MILTAAFVDDVEGLIALVEACANERAKYSVLFVFAVVENADVAIPLECRHGYRDDCWALLHKCFLLSEIFFFLFLCTLPAKETHLTSERPGASAGSTAENA